MNMSSPDQHAAVTVERLDSLLVMGLNRPAKRNAFNQSMIDELSLAYAQLEHDPSLRCGVLFGHGDHFTAGLDLGDVLATVMQKGWRLPHDGIDFVGLYTEPISKPIVAAVQGYCFTIGIEILLAADIRVAADDTQFAQMEVQRGIMPFGGATIRFARDCGWGNAMRYMLTGAQFDAAEAFRIGLIQEAVEPGKQLDRAVEIAREVAAQAPLGVNATLRNARLAMTKGGERAAARELLREIKALMATEDAREGFLSFIERRPGVFIGR